MGVFILPRCQSGFIDNEAVWHPVGVAMSWTSAFSWA